LKSKSTVILRLLSILVLLVGVVGLFFVPNPGTVAGTERGQNLRPIPNTGVNRLGATFFLDRETEPWKIEQTLAFAKEAGVRWVKLQFAWSRIEPRRGEFWEEAPRTSTWDRYDAIVDACEKHGLRVIACLDSAPAWARPAGSEAAAAPDDPALYGEFVATVVKRYRGRIQHYQIWSEPNLASAWGAQPSAVQYVELLRAAYASAKAADPNALILSAPLAPVATSSSGALCDLDYLQDLYSAGAASYFDILSAQAFAGDRPPEDLPAADAINFQRTRLLREVMERSGDVGKAVWITGFGWNAAPATAEPQRPEWQPVSEERQADYVAGALRLAQDWEWLGVMCLYYFRQAGDIPPAGEQGYYFRAVDVDFTPRLLYHTLCELSGKLSASQPGEHEAAAAGASWGAGWAPTLDSTGRTLLASSAPPSNLSLQFEGTDIWVILGPERGASRLYVQVDGRGPRDLPRDDSGRRYVDLTALPEGEQRVVGARDLASKRHTLELTVDEPAKSTASGPLLVITGFAVERRGESLAPFCAFTALGAIGIATLSYSLVSRRAR